MVNSVLLPELSVPSFNFQLLNPPLQSELSTSPISEEAITVPLLATNCTLILGFEA